ncbi:hypothetical protein I4U23_014107 [Adineta vaga]|nr:hypothetical protein I4U23_014107 [Adineta vaga]
MKEDSQCSFIETLSFGSDIDVKCNNSYLIFNEINSNGFNWKFANTNSFCQHRGKYQGFVHQCNITRLGSEYLKVPVISIDHGEQACIYCRIHYQPIAPMITVTQTNNSIHTFYTFNLTATGLDDQESFEIVWARRSGQIEYSMNHWFLHGCVDSAVEILEDTGHQIIFLVDDVPIDRVEFIIRRCSNTCQSYRTCDNDEISERSSPNYFHTPDSIEKISCDSDCLNGFVVSPTTINNMIDKEILLSTIQLTNRKQTIKFLILCPIFGLLIVLMFGTVVFFLISRVQGLRRANIYTKASHINLDENKETIK